MDKLSISWDITYGLKELAQLLQNLHIAIPSHVRCQRNQLADMLVNVGIETKGGKIKVVKSDI